MIGVESERRSSLSITSLLDAVLNSWDRNNTILVNLLRAVPKDGLTAKATPTGPSVAQMFTHIHYVRLVLISEDAPDFAVKVPESEWADDFDRDRIAQALNQSADAVRDVVSSKLRTAGEMKVHYDHPLLFLQHMIWHEGYHHGQIKLALKLAGLPIRDEDAGPITWDVWMEKTGTK